MLQLLGYADKLSVQPGQTIKFMVSCEDGAPSFHADVVRLICSDDSPSGPGFKEVLVETPLNGQYPGRRQRAYAGSYALIPTNPVFRNTSSFTIEVMVWATTPDQGSQGLVTRWDKNEGSGFGLIINELGTVALVIDSKSVVSSDKPIMARMWTLVAASYDAIHGIATLQQRPLMPPPYADSPNYVETKIALPPRTYQDMPLIAGAWHKGWDGNRHVADGHFNGKLARPRIYDRVLNLDEVGREVPDSAGLLAAWDFGRDMESEKVTDISINQLDGKTINLPTRAVTGPGWSGSAMNWTECPNEYDAIHFHEDDLLDCGWDADVTFSIPDEFRSGVYALRCRSSTGEQRIPFFVRPKRGSTVEKIALLMPTATYMMYGNQHANYREPLNEMMRGGLIELLPSDLYLNDHPEFGLSSYDTHCDGSGVFYVTRHRPILNLQPMTRLWNFNIDMFIVDWLEARGTAFDVITDEDLHNEGLDLLKPYQVVITGSHPEYTSLPMMEALHGYRDGGGRIMYLGGNGFYWRISFHQNIPGVIEARRMEGSRSWDVEPGERYHSFDGCLGGLWRYQRYTTHGLVGVGMNSEGFDMCTHYRRQPDSFDPRVSFIFEGVDADEKIGDFGVCSGGAAGYETDRFDPSLGTPANALLLASSEGLSRLYRLVLEELPFTTPANTADETSMVRADMVFFNCPNGGAVFSVGSIAWPGSLPHNMYDNNVSRITGNVLERFLEPESL